MVRLVGAPRLLLCSMLLVLSLVPTAVRARQADLPSEFPSGSPGYQIYVYASLETVGMPSLLMIPGEGLSGNEMRTHQDGSPGWGDLAMDRGFNAFAMDLVGCGSAPTPSTDDYDQKMEHSVFGAYATGLGALPKVLIAHGSAAAFAMKARSWDALVAETMVLIDPIGPNGSQPFEKITVDDVLARRQDREDLTWKKLGFGPRRGVLREGVDIDLERAEDLLSRFEFDQPAFEVNLLTPLDSPTTIREPIKLEGLQVLVLRTPAADARQIAREKAFVAWMRERGMTVETMDLATMPAFAGLTGLPWIGELAEPTLDLILEWYRKIYLSLPGS